MIIRRLPGLLLALCCGLAWIVQAQNEDDDARIIEEDHRVTSVTDRQQAVTNLLAKADELRNSAQIVEAVRALNRVGRFQIRMYKLNEAVETFQQGLKQLDQQPDIKTRIDSLNGLASAYDWQSRCDLVEVPVQEAINLSKQSNNVAGHAEALLTLSDCQNHNDHALAFRTAQESLELYRSINRKRGMAEVSKVMCHYQLAQDNLAEANRYIHAALDLYTELNDINEQASILVYLGYIELRNGAWQDAMAYYSRTQSMIDEKAEPYRMGQIAGGLGEAFLESGSPDVALEKYKEAMEYFRVTNNQRVITLMVYLIGQAQYFLGRHQEAIDSLQKARAEATASKDIAVTAYCDDFLGRTYFALNDHAAALKHYQLALQGYATAKNPMEKARVEALIGQVYRQQGNLEKAKDNFQIALDEFRVLGDRVNESATLYALGKLELDRNALDEARDYLQQSIDVTEDFRRASTSSDLTTAFSARVYDRYEAFIECLMRKHTMHPSMHQDVDAFETHELARARSLTELLRATQTNLLKGLDPQLAEQEKSLRQTLRVKSDAKVKLLATAYKREALTNLDSELSRIGAEYKDVKAAIKTRFPAYDQITSPPKLTLKQIQDEILTDNDTMLLEYALGSRKSYLWAVTRGSFLSYELPARAEIEKSALQLYELLTSRQSRGLDQRAESSFNSQVAALSNTLLGPVADELNHRRLLIVADGVLQRIPFQVLSRPNQGVASTEPRPLVLDHEIVNEPSASTLALLLSESEKRKEPQKSVAILADPVFAADDSRLRTSTTGTLVAAPQAITSELTRSLRDVGIERSEIPRLLSSRDEAEAIISMVPWRTGFKAVDFQANRATVTGSDLAQYRVVHFATHAFLINDHPERSGIVLSMVDEKGQTQDGYLRLNDIYNLKLPVDLVVLSACQTGLGKDVKGEGLIGLTRGFMYAGASGVVASLWKVDDEATAELMKYFYQGLFEKGLSPAAALREAQLTLRKQKRWQEPYFWAGFVIQGQYANNSNRRYQLTPAISLTGAIVLGGMSLLAATLVFRRRKHHRVKKSS
jgi:CHAT domain-containing protein